MLSKYWLACAVAILPGTAYAAVTEDTFKLQTTSDLVELCSTPPADPMGTAALNFCHGFAVGVYRVLTEQNAAHRAHMFCAPTPGPSRNQAIADFVQWANANPSIMQEPPADGLTAYIVKSFPCPRGK
jgi:Rap1a immunity proteins